MHIALRHWTSKILQANRIISSNDTVFHPAFSSTTHHNVTYINFVCTMHPNKSEVHRDAYQDVRSPAVSALDA